MADDTQDSTDNGLSAPPQGVNPQLFVLLKQKFPTMSDSDIATAIKTSDAQAIQNGQKPPSQQDIGSVNAAIGAGQQQAASQNGSPVPTPAAQPAAPTAAAQDLLYQGNGPTANRLNAIDPAAIRDAYMKQYVAQGGGNTTNQMGDLFGASVRAGIGGMGQAAMTDYQNKWNTINGLPAAGEKAAQDAANTGLTAANNTAKTTQENNTAASQLDMAKKKFVTDMGLANLNLDQQSTAWNAVKGIYDPTSTSSKINQSLAAQMMGLPTSTFTGQSAAEIAAEVKNLDPALAVNKQAYDQLIAKMNADSGRITASAGAASSYANAGATNLGTNLVKSATNGGTTLPAGMNLSVGAGPASLTPSPAVTGAQTGAATTTNDQRSQVTAYQNNGTDRAVNGALSTLKGASFVDTGTLGDYLNKIPNSNAQQIQGQLTQYYMSKGMTPEQAQQQTTTLFQSSPRIAYKQILGIKANNEVQKQTLADQDSFVKNSGSLTGYQPKQYIPFFNPSSGDIKLGDSPNDRPKNYIDVTGSVGAK